MFGGFKQESFLSMLKLSLSYYCLAENRQVVYLGEHQCLKYILVLYMGKYVFVTTFLKMLYCCLFLSVERGRVYIRDWRDRKSSRTDAKRKPVAPGAVKTRLCWFHTHHPQACPLQAEDCAFAHGPDDLRPSTRPLKKLKHNAFWLDLCLRWISSKHREFYWCIFTSFLGITECDGSWYSWRFHSWLCYLVEFNLKDSFIFLLIFLTSRLYWTWGVYQVDFMLHLYLSKDYRGLSKRQTLLSSGTSKLLKATAYFQCWLHFFSPHMHFEVHRQGGG